MQLSTTSDLVSQKAPERINKYLLQRGNNSTIKIVKDTKSTKDGYR